MGISKSFAQEIVLFLRSVTAWGHPRNRLLSEKAISTTDSKSRFPEEESGFVERKCQSSDQETTLYDWVSHWYPDVRTIWGLTKLAAK